MKSRVLWISALLASLGAGAQADTIALGGKSVHQPTLIRGAPLRCHEKRPLIINVQASLQNRDKNVQKCETEFRPTHSDRAHFITNIIVIAGRHERVYIKPY